MTHNAKAFRKLGQFIRLSGYKCSMMIYCSNIFKCSILFLLLEQKSNKDPQQGYILSPPQFFKCSCCLPYCFQRISFSFNSILSYFYTRHIFNFHFFTNFFQKSCFNILPKNKHVSANHVGYNEKLPTWVNRKNSWVVA